MSINFKKLSAKSRSSTAENLVLLHGWQHSMLNFMPLAKLLAQKFNVYLVDLPGFGASDLPADAANWNTGNYVAAMIKFIDQENIERPILVGHSFGGKLAVKIAALYPEKLADRLVLIGTPGLRARRSPQDKLRTTALVYGGKILKAIDRVFRTNLFAKFFIRKFASVDYKNSQALKNILVRTINEDLEKFAVQISQKTLLLWGQKDTAAPLNQAKAYNELISNSRLRLLKNHGHTPFADVGSHLCYTIISDFLEKNSLAEASV